MSFKMSSKILSSIAKNFLQQSWNCTHCDSSGTIKIPLKTFPREHLKITIEDEGQQMHIQHMYTDTVVSCTSVVITCTNESSYIGSIQEYLERIHDL